MGVRAAPRIVVRESPEEQLCEETTVRAILRVILAVLEAPRRQVGGSEVGSEKTIATGEAHGIGEDGTGDGVTWAETCTRLGVLGFFGLKSDV